MAWQARNSGTLPILSSPQLTFETAAALANVEGYISAKTPLKVERAQVRILYSPTSLFLSLCDILCIEVKVLTVDSVFLLTDVI